MPGGRREVKNRGERQCLSVWRGKERGENRVSDNIWIRITLATGAPRVCRQKGRRVGTADKTAHVEVRWKKALSKALRARAKG